MREKKPQEEPFSYLATKALRIVNYIFERGPKETADAARLARSIIILFFNTYECNMGVFVFWSINSVCFFFFFLSRTRFSRAGDTFIECIIIIIVITV